MITAVQLREVIHDVLLEQRVTALTIVADEVVDEQVSAAVNTIVSMLVEAGYVKGNVWTDAFEGIMRAATQAVAKHIVSSYNVPAAGA